MINRSAIHVLETMYIMTGTSRSGTSMRMSGGGSGCILYVTLYQTISCKNFKTKQDIMRSAREVMGGQSAYFAAQNQTEKKRSEETQTLRAGCSKAETKFSPHCRPPSRGARKGQNLISWRWSLHLPTNPVW